MGGVDGGDNERDEGISSMVLGVGEDGVLGESEGDFWRKEREIEGLEVSSSS